MVIFTLLKGNTKFKDIFGKEQINMPSKSTLHRILTNIDNNEFEKVFRKRIKARNYLLAMLIWLKKN